MTTKRVAGAAALLIFALAFGPGIHGPGFASASPVHSHSPAYQSAAKKIDFLTANGRRSSPQPATTTLTADEINAYVAEGGVALPVGVQRVRFSSIPAVVTGSARVDFDQIVASKRAANPLLAALFTGVHEVVVQAQATGSNGTGSVRVESMAIDGMEIPRAAVQFFIERYLKPKYGANIGLDSSFRLPARINLAIVGSNQVTLTQR